mgnify:CR=1 FL=1
MFVIFMHGTRNTFIEFSFFVNKTVESLRGVAENTRGSVEEALQQQVNLLNTQKIEVSEGLVLRGVWAWLLKNL